MQRRHRIQACRCTLQDLLPALAMVLHRGRDNPSVFAALEACALLGGLQVLLPFQEAVLGGLLRSIAALEAAIASTMAAEPAGKGVLPAERPCAAPSGASVSRACLPQEGLPPSPRP